MLPAERAAWKYTVTVATTCFPSFLPRNPETWGRKVAMLPRRYAMEHFSMLFPSLDVAKSEHHSTAFLNRDPSRWGRVSSAEESCEGGWRRGVVSSGSAMEPSGPPRSVKTRLTRSPVLGRINVAWRSYATVD